MNSSAQTRLQEAIASLGENPSSVAKRLTMTPQNLHAILKGRPVREHFATMFENEFGISRRWILAGEGEMWHQRPREQDAELPEFDRFPTAPISVSAVMGATFKVPRHYLCGTRPELFRYVLRVGDDILTPFVLKEDRLLMDGRFDIDIRQHHQFVDERLCAIEFEKKSMLRWVRAGLNHGKFEVQLFTGPNRKEKTLRAEQTKKLKIVGVCVGLIWRPLEALFILEERLESNEKGE